MVFSTIMVMMGVLMLCMSAHERQTSHRIVTIANAYGYLVATIGLVIAGATAVGVAPFMVVVAWTFATYCLVMTLLVVFGLGVAAHTNSY